MYEYITNDWQVIGASAHGAKHILEGKPNQDRIMFFASGDAVKKNLQIILAVADGHGAQIHFRSEKGAEIAVNSAIEVCKKLENSSFNSLKDTKIKEWVCRDIYRKWVETVQRDIEENKFSDEEKILLQSKKTEPEIPQVVTDNHELIAYGSTLLTAIIHDNYILFLQLGDGDIFVINPDGTIDRPIPEDNRFVGTETTSLCLPEAWYEFKIKLKEIRNNFDYPLMILLSTDGLKGSWSEGLPDRGFNKFGLDILTMICKNTDGIHAGFDEIDESLLEWLSQISKNGIGDDTTAGMIFYIPQIKKYQDETYVNFIQKKKLNQTESENTSSENIVEQNHLNSNDTKSEISDAQFDNKMIEENSSTDQL
jgi:hypothetical protein